MTELRSLRVGRETLERIGNSRLVTLAIPKDLEERFTLFQNTLTQEEENKTMGRIVGALPVDAISGLRTISPAKSIRSRLNSQNMVNPEGPETSTTFPSNLMLLKRTWFVSLCIL